MIDYELLKILGTAVGLGLLVGLQREYDDHKMAGIRTFTLVTLFGSITGLLAQELNQGIIIAASIVGLVALVAVVNFYKLKKDDPDIGQTTEVALIIMYCLGAYLIYGDLSIGIAIGATIAILLHYKYTLGGFVDKLEPKDIKAIMQFAAISLIILPILPDETYGPYDVLNPRGIWMMVVLIVGLGLGGYFIYKLLGKKSGTLLNGILGGLISSTATTVTFSRRTKKDPSPSRTVAFIILVASTIAVIRVMFEVAIISPQNLAVVAPPLIVELIFMGVLCGVLYYFNQNEEVGEVPEPGNPAQLKSALIFGALYAIILFSTAAAKDFFGNSGLYAVSIISGLTDVDAITLSLANSMNSGEIESHSAWKFILIANLSNLVFKAGLASSLGSKKLAKHIWIYFILSIIAGILLIWLWPKAWVF